MLELKLNTSHWYYINCYVPTSFKSQFKRGMRGLVYLLLPEDTTGNAIRRNNESDSIDVNNTRSVFKAGFWIVVSIAASLALGQL